MPEKPVVAEGPFLRWVGVPFRLVDAAAVHEVRPPAENDADQDGCWVTLRSQRCWVEGMSVEAFAEEWRKALEWGGPAWQKGLVIDGQEER